MKLVADTKSIDLVQIHAEARRASMQIGQMFDYFEDRFKTLLVACRQSGTEGVDFNAVHNHRIKMELRQEQVAQKMPSARAAGKPTTATHHRAFRVARAM
mmetsp:Transcript_16972/g.38089  ORF Transcript_16972/g.38089 Transcript_16972/m.38089 type:complete len:100 (+) Transcript_16972:2-301(+)